MTPVKRSEDNPILGPELENEWEAAAAFNGSVIKKDNLFHILYRAMSKPKDHKGVTMQLSTIGHATSKDSLHFSGKKLFIEPSEDWDGFGCEDPRVTEMEGRYYIFYTALSRVPFDAQSIKVAVAITDDLTQIAEKHLVTPFNAKAMALFPKKIKDKYVAFVTANTDCPPAKIALARFDKIEDLWSRDYWDIWYKNIDQHIIPLQRNKNDQIEGGAAPVYTDYGWIMIYSYIKDYFASKRKFWIECVVLDKEDPQKIIGRIEQPILMPETHYEFYGNVPNIVFPSGALINEDELYIYYGAADTTCCLAKVNLKEFIEKIHFYNTRTVSLVRSNDNPILKPKLYHFWEAKATFNPGAFWEQNKVHIVYRAMSKDNTSTLGYAISSDGVHIDERLFDPIYTPHEPFEHKKKEGNSGVEDPRITKIGDTLYMTYTAFDAESPPRVALTSIAVSDFLNRKWAWERSVLISPPGIDDKDACVFPEKVNGKYVIFHRILPEIVVDFVDNLNFDGKTNWLKVQGYINPRPDSWDNDRIGICGPPIKTNQGWLAFYHGVNSIDFHYRVGAMLLKLDDPRVVLARSDNPIMEPIMDYERIGQTKNVVFPCANILIDDVIYVYYGGADSVAGVATIKLKDILSCLS